PSVTCTANYTTPTVVTWSKIPQDVVSFNTFNTGKMTSFSACIDVVNTTAQVFLRGNALARLQKDNLNYKDSSKTYFPNASIRVQGRGYLFTK
ncbi:MAG: hormogonium polysaccharide secretion pseudopilin HpsC, partial [Nostoc sp.]